MQNVVIILLLTLIHSAISYGPFPITHIGNFLTLEDYKNLPLCESQICLSDAEKLISDASYDTTIDPCKSFKNFSCGTFYKERARNERYENVGFERSFELKNDERRHRVMKVSIQENDGKAVKVLKNFYQKCINSKYIEGASRQDVLNYFNSFGKFPLLTKNWTDSDLNFTKIFNEINLEFLINYRVGFCPDPNTQSDDILCFRKVTKHTWERYKTTSSNFTAKDVQDMLKVFSISTENVDEMIDEFFNISTQRFRIYNQNLNKPVVLEIKNISNYSQPLSIDWVRLINFQLPSWLHCDENSKILPLDFNAISSDFQFLSNVNKRTLADIIFIKILYEYRNLFEIYPFNYKQFKSAVKTPQRFEICNGLVNSLMPLPAQALFSRKFFSKTFKVAAEHLMKSAVEFLNKQFKETELKNLVEFIAGYPRNADEDSFLDKIYQNLTLHGNESLLETYRELLKFQRYIELVELNRDELDTLKIAQHVGQDLFSCSIIKLKFLYCPASVLQYPMYHPDRSVFYNYALLVPEIYDAIYKGLPEWFDFYENDAAFSFYKKYVDDHGPEESLPGFFLSNEQMFWVAMQNKKCEKFSESSGYGPAIRSSGHFYEVFNCSKNEDALGWIT